MQFWGPPRRHERKGDRLRERQDRVRRCSFWSVIAVTGFAGLGWWAAAQGERTAAPARFTMARVRYGTPNFGGFRRRFEPPWSHDYPRSERNFMKILSEVTRIDANPDGHIISFDSAEVFRYPIAYLCEVGYLDLSEIERRNMSEYLLRGGFLIVDDFRGERDLYNFIEQMRLVFPNRSLEELPRSHPIFSCFYDVSDVFLPPPYSRGLLPQYFGMADDNGRLMMVVNYNTDISEYWEYSDDPFMPIDETNQAYKYGVNYVMYALTH